MTTDRTYVGFGFGAIQAGLFLYEAQRSGAFSRLVVAEVLPEVVAAVRHAGGSYCVNIAHPDRIERACVGPIAIAQPAVEADRDLLTAAVADAAEIGVAVPSVQSYVTSEPSSLHRILAAGLRQKARQGSRRAVVYAAENHNRAAEILEETVFSEIPAAEQAAVHRRVRFLNTVIGKMSGVVADPVEMQVRGLAPIAPGLSRAFLVEAFNRILISQIRFPGRSFCRGIAIFEEKSDLLPFEEAKLYGHNATHALAAYLGVAAGVVRMADLPNVPGALPFLRAAFIAESGTALIRKHGAADPLFTQAGYADYVDDLLSRMISPYLGDSAERVARDPRRKLGWDDRLIGTIRLALSQGIRPRRYAFGAAAALAYLDPSYPEQGCSATVLRDRIWPETTIAAQELETVLAMIEDGRRRLRDWLVAGRPDLEGLFR